MKTKEGGSSPSAMACNLSLWGTLICFLVGAVS